MAIKPVLVYKNSDSTADLNSRAARILDRGIFDGGHLSPSGSALSMSVAPFIAVGYDGMVAVSDTTEVVSVPAPAAAGPNRVSYLILHLEYRSLTASIANLQVVPETTWSTSISKEYFVTFARIEVPFGATSLQDPGVIIDYASGDWAEKAGKAGWRAPVADVASLPTLTAGGPNLGNRDGDVRLTLDTYTLYAWDASTDSWGPVGGALDLRDVSARSDMVENQMLRSWNGSGLVATTNNDGAGGGFKNVKAGVDWEIQASSADRIDIAPLHAVVNGHYVKTVYTELTLTAPAAGRYDCIYLEVWRESIAGAVSAETYPNDPTVGGTSTFAQLLTHLETLLEQRTTPNMGVSKIEVVDSTTIVATRWRIASVANVSTLSINDTLQAAITATNIDSNPFTVLGAQNDPRVWRSTAPSAYDGISWAIPLVIVRRTLSEVGPSSYILETRPDDDDNRYVYDVAPRAELGIGFSEMSEGTASATTSGFSYVKNASGFLRGMQSSLTGNTGTLDIPESVVRVRGAELVTLAGPVSAALPTAPGAGSRRDLVVLEVELTSHPHDRVEFSGPVEIFRYPRQGIRAAQWVGRTRVFDVGLDLDTPDAMATAGYSQVSGDPGLWERAPASSEDSNTIGSVLAVPVALIHRRNSAAFAVPSNPNGSSGRPDGISDPELPAAKEILDLRHRAVESEAEAADIMRDSIDKLFRGELRTRMRPAPFLANTAGIQTLQVDQISSASTSGTLNITPLPEGSTTVWGDSEEAVLLTAVFPSWDTGGVPVTDGSTTPTFTWIGTPTEGDLTIKAPPGYVLNIDPDQASSPLGPGSVLLGTATVGTGTATDIFREASFGVGVIPVSDADGNLIQFATGAVLTPLPAGADPGGQVYVQVWARRPTRGSSTAGTYSANSGMFEVADKVHRIEYFDGVSTSEIDAAPIVAQVTATPVADVVTITQADLFAALGGGGNRYATASSDLSMYGILDVQIQDAGILQGSGLPKIRYVDLTDAAGTAPGFERIRIEFAAGIVAVPVTFTIAFDGDLINRWALVTPMNRGVRGLYSWHATAIGTSSSGVAGAREILPTRGAGALPQRSFMVPTRDGGYSGSLLGTLTGQGATQALSWGPASVILYARNVTAATPQWRLWTDPADRDATNIGLGNDFRYGSLEPAQDPYNSADYSGFASAGYGFYPGFDIEFLVVSPCRVPLTDVQALTIYYDMTPYQGLADAYPLEEKTTGRVVEVGDAFVHTLGTNMPWLSPRALTWNFSGDLRLDFDVGSRFSLGQDLLALQRIHLATNPSASLATHDGPEPRRPIGALTRRLPFGASAYGFDDWETNFANFVIDLQPHTVQRIILPEEASGDDVSIFVGMDYNVGSWLAGAANEFVYYPLIAPLGASINSIELRAGVTGGASADFSLDILRKSVSAPPGILAGSVTATVENETLLYREFEGQNTFVNDSSNLVLRIISGTGGVSSHVYDARIYYASPGSGSVDRLNRMLRFPYPQGGTAQSQPLHKGALLENPWAPADFAALEAIYLKNGDDTYGSSIFRGRVSVAPIDLGSTTLTGSFGAFLYYVPLSDLDSATVSGFNPLDVWSGQIAWPLTTASRALTLPRSFAGERYNLFSAQTPVPITGNFLHAGTVLPYVIRNGDGLLSLVVSHSGVSATATTSSGSRITAEVGSLAAVDAFYPAGRPVYIKED